MFCNAKCFVSTKIQEQINFKWVKSYVLLSHLTKHWIYEYDGGWKFTSMHNHLFRRQKAWMQEWIQSDDTMRFEMKRKITHTHSTGSKHVSVSQSNPNIPKHITSDFVVAINICYAGPIARQRIQHDAYHKLLNSVHNVYTRWYIYIYRILLSVQLNSINSIVVISHENSFSNGNTYTIWHLLCEYSSTTTSLTQSILILFSAT